MSKKYLRKLRASEVAKFNLAQRFDKIDWEEDMLKPLLEKAELEATAKLAIPEFVIEEDSPEDQENHKETQDS